MNKNIYKAVTIFCGLELQPDLVLKPRDEYRKGYWRSESPEVGYSRGLKSEKTNGVCQDVQVSSHNNREKNFLGGIHVGSNQNNKPGNYDDNYHKINNWLIHVTGHPA